MGIKFDSKTQTFEVSFSKRHPKTRMPKRMARKGIKTKAEAQKVLRKLIIEVEKAFEEPEPGTILYRDLLKRFYQSLVDRDFTFKTVENYTTCLNAHTDKLWYQQAIDSVLAVDLKDGFSFKRNKGEILSNEIRKYDGAQFTIICDFAAKQQNRFNLDIGVGDIVTPTKAKLPTLKDFEASSVELLVYPPETIAAEKLHAIINHGIKNSRFHCLCRLSFCKAL